MFDINKENNKPAAVAHEASDETLAKAQPAQDLLQGAFGKRCLSCGYVNKAGATLCVKCEVHQ